MYDLSHAAPLSVLVGDMEASNTDSWQSEQIFAKGSCVFINTHRFGELNSRVKI